MRRRCGDGEGESVGDSVLLSMVIPCLFPPTHIKFFITPDVKVFLQTVPDVFPYLFASASMNLKLHYPLK